MKYLLFVLLLISNGVTQAQPQDVAQLITTARSFQRQADYDNAVLVLTKALQQSPDNNDIIKELSFTYYLQGSYDKAVAEIKKIVDKEDADEQTYQIAGTLYKSMQNFKESERLYKKGIKKFPASGALYSEYGQVLYEKDHASDLCIKTWEQGIQADPNYSGNYYYACRYYGTVGNYLWCLLYGELFTNLESYSTRTVEIKNILFDVYKQWFVSGRALGNSAFEQQAAATLSKQGKEGALGISVETLTAIRTLFILDWFNSATARPAFRLFDYQRQLLQQGMFDAYNQWLFGSVASTAAYQNWVNTHAEDNKSFTEFQRGRIFKVPEGQYYKAP